MNNQNFTITKTLSNFRLFLNQKANVPIKSRPFYVHWIEKFLLNSTDQITEITSITDSDVSTYLSLLSKEKEDWQVSQAAARFFRIKRAYLNFSQY